MENEIIANVIKELETRAYYFLKEHGSNFKELRDKGVSVNGFTFIEDTWAYLVFKPTDIGEQPQFKGEDLCKIVPKFVDNVDCIWQILDAEAWTYL